jgi:ABC-type proline/glycine betaine transport system permease subunit
MNFLQFMMANRQQVLDLTLEHITLAGVATLLAALVGIPLGILITRVPQLSKPVLGGANIIQTIPSLALFGFLLPAPWIGERAGRLAILALALYALLPLIRNTYAGIQSVDPAVVEAGRAMGLTDANCCGKWSCRSPPELLSLACGLRPCSPSGWRRLRRRSARAGWENLFFADWPWSTIR